MLPSSNPTQQLKSPAGPSTSNVEAQSAVGGAKKRKHRGAKRKRNRRQSFATRSEATDTSEMAKERPSLLDAPTTQSAPRPDFYRLGQNHSNTSLDSDVLLDHRWVVHVSLPVVSKLNEIVTMETFNPDAKVYRQEC